MSLAQGSDAILDQKLAYPAYNRLKNHFAKTTNPGDLQEGMLWFDKTNQKMILQKSAGPVDLVPAISVFLEGTIIPWVGGYFTDGANGGYTRVLGATNNPAGVNAWANSKGWYVCDGAALNIPESTIYDGPGRYLPNLTDDRFLMGDNLVGTVGGSNSSAHTHGVGSFVNAAEAAHTHGYVEGATTTDGAHEHSTGGPSSQIVVCAQVATSYAAHTDHTHNVNSGGAHYHGWGAWTAAGSSHGHAISGSTAAGSSHAHTASGAATGAGSSHGHAISGDTGAASGASDNRPVYLGVLFLQYVLAA